MAVESRVNRLILLARTVLILIAVVERRETIDIIDKPEPKVGGQKFDGMGCSGGADYARHLWHCGGRPRQYIDQHDYNADGGSGAASGGCHAGTGRAQPESHKRIWSHNDEQDKQINEHEKKLTEHEGRIRNGGEASLKLRALPVKCITKENEKWEKQRNYFELQQR